MPGSGVHLPIWPHGGLRVGLVAGETSGDLLGAGLARALRQRCPDVQLAGIAGPAMQAEGVESWEPMEQLSVMGLTEVLRHLPGLLRLRRRLVESFVRFQPQVVVGLDAPDFNLGLEKRLRGLGLRTVHYVSPSIWAWRSGRVRTVAQAADEVLCLLPFEPPLYSGHGVKARFVGHPMADEISLERDRAGARAALGLDGQGDGALVALLPGSRHGEVARIGSVLAGAAARLAQARPGTCFIAAMASPSLSERFAAQCAQYAPGVHVRRVAGRAREVMAAADLVLLASGTATLEAALLKTPMVVVYRVSPATAGIVRALGLVKTRHVALPNLLAGEALVPELIQGEATPERVAEEALRLLDDGAGGAWLETRFAALHQVLRQGANQAAADAVLSVARQATQCPPDEQ